MITLLSSLFSAVPAHAYSLTQTQSGHNISWQYGQKFYLAGNPTNNSGLSSTSLWRAVVNGLQQWNRATEGLFDFDYWQGTNLSIYEASLKQDGLNAIFFASNSHEKADPNVIGFTQVWFNTSNGEMIEADIMLNDHDYRLTDDPADTSSHRATEGLPRVYVNNVITHEIGHALGLSHSNSINSSMLYVEFSEQFKLGCDDWSAAKHLYPIANNGMGSLTGTILSPKNEPFAGAVVTAISINRGVPVASVMTDQNGFYQFGALETGSFSLMVEAFQGTATSVPVRMRIKTSEAVCDESKFPKNFITDSDSHSLQKFQVTAGKNSNIGSYTLTCNEVSDSGTTLSSNSPEVLVDRAATNTSRTYTFNANGPFQINGLGYLLMSPLKVALTVLDSAGKPIEVQSQTPLYRSEVSEYKIQDSSVNGVAFGPITVKVDVTTSELTGFPTPAIWPSKSLYYVVVFNPNPNTGTSSTIPNNARCSAPDSFPNYQSPAGDPIRDSTTTTTRDSIGFCGNAHAASFREGHHPRTHSQSLPLGNIIGWALPFLAAFACQLFLRLRRAKLRA